MKAEEHEPAPWEAKSACRFCPIGAANAGRTIAPMAKATSDLRKLCPRCQRPASRIIRGHHCVSCYNRDREAAAGRNAKGTRPALSDQLHTVVVCVAEGPAVAVRSAPRVKSRVEAMLAMAKRARAPMAFGAAPFVPGRMAA